MKQDFSFWYFCEEYDQIFMAEEFNEKVYRATELGDIKQECMDFESSDVVDVSNDHVFIKI
jgi:hypothetical protein